MRICNVLKKEEKDRGAPDQCFLLGGEILKDGLWRIVGEGEKGREGERGKGESGRRERSFHFNSLDRSPSPLQQPQIKSNTQIPIISPPNLPSTILYNHGSSGGERVNHSRA